MWRKGRRGQQSLGGQRGQSNFELAANFGYDSRGSADPRESLRKRRISKLALTTHTVRVPLETGLFRCPSDNNFSFPFLKTMKVLATFSYLYYDRTIEFTKNPIKIGPADQLLIYHAIKT